MEEEEEKDEEGGGRPDTGPSMTAINAMLPKCISFLHRFQACWVQDTPQTDYYMHVKRLSKTDLRPAGCKILHWLLYGENEEEDEDEEEDGSGWWPRILE